MQDSVWIERIIKQSLPVGAKNPTMNVFCATAQAESARAMISTKHACASA